MLSLCLNLKGNQLSQWQNCDFASMAKIGGQYVGAGESGLMRLESGDFDNGAPIEAFFELATSDWGVSEQKRVRALYLGYESDGNLMVTVRDDDGNERSFTVAPNHSANLQHSAKVSGARDGKGRYWMIRVDNVNGADFSIDSIHVLPVVLNRRPSAA
jgi:hypothetical protein